ncbi:MAG: hypothetical protein IPM55_06895 [Acidobacteria bacterium]|nr:hypothetical protein [Acidobacteriota bacterium]
MNNSSTEKNRRDKQTALRSILKLCGIWLALSLALTLPRTVQPAYGIQGDLTLHYHITRSYAQSVEEGDLLPRWAGLLDGGRGDALFTFYPPLSYALSAIPMVLFGLSTLDSLKLVSVLTIFLAQLSAWLLAREFFDRRRSLIVSSLYVLLPAYPLIALHRAFFANGLALGLAPLALLGAWRLLTGERVERGLAIFLASMSAVVLSHAITAYLTGVTIGLMALALFKRTGWRGMLRLAGAGLGAMALTAFFLWPQFIERNWVQLGLQVVQQDFRNYFLFATAPDATKYRQAWANVNYVTSLVILSQTLTGLLLAAIAGRASLLFKKTERLNEPAVSLSGFGLLVVLFGLLIAAPWSEPLWRYLPGLKFIQFPWRFQPYVSLATGLLAASATLEWGGLRRRPRLLISALLTWLVIVNAVFTFMFVRLNESGISRDQVSNLLGGAGAQAFNAITIEEGRKLQNEDDLKYVPYTANQIYFRPPGSAFTLYPPAKRPGGIEPVDGTAKLLININKITHREYSFESETPVRLRIATHAYPHWVVRLDGREIPVEKESGSGLMLVDVPAGDHKLALNFEVREISERIARWISIGAWLLLAGWIGWRRSGIYLKRQDSQGFNAKDAKQAKRV